MLQYDDLYIPHPRMADTQELDLAGLLSTEAQDAHEAEQLVAVRDWLKNALA